jgi:hypothetical protein
MRNYSIAVAGRSSKKKLHGRDEMYDVILPRVVLHNVKLVAAGEQGENSFRQNRYLWRNCVRILRSVIPLGDKKPMNHFPHQLVMMIPVPVVVSELNFSRAQICSPTIQSGNKINWYVNVHKH